MCHEATGSAYDRPLFKEDVPLISAEYPRLPENAVQAVYAAITDHHWPQPAVLIAVLELIDRSLRQDCGYYTQPTMPFSAMDIDTFERVQTDGMYAFHTVFESMALAERNMQLLNEVLATHFNLRLVLFCDCGCGIVPADTDPFTLSWYKEINQLRSLAEAVGTAVVRLTDFDQPGWQDRNLDMGNSEQASYNKMFAILSSLPRREFDIKELASPEFADLFMQKEQAA